MPLTELISSIEGRPEEQEREAAAVLIQRTWRGRRDATKVKEEHLSDGQRWDDAVADARMEVARKEAAKGDGHESPRDRWRRAVFLIGRMLDQHPLYKRNDQEEQMTDETKEYLKQLEGQHWLELIDRKHRYGSNLKWYHQNWQQSDTKENFFKWLDEGEGKDLDLKECARERLESERIIYLSTEQRLNYLVKVTDSGKLVWAKNEQPVDTTAGEWKDTEQGQGIVAQHLPATPASENPWPVPNQHERDTGKLAFQVPDSSDGRGKGKGPKRSNSDGSLDSELQKNEATHYSGNDVDGEVKGKHTWTRYLWRHLTIRGVMEKLLRKTVQKNTWMYISDMDYNIYIGIKETGYFQHSSFLAGGVVTSAGLIKVKEGQIRSISPLSGHYRTSHDHFKKFVDVLDERGVDLSRVSISKAEAALWGIEHLGKAQKTVKAGKKAVASGPSALKNVFSRDDKQHDNGQKAKEEGEGDAGKKSESQNRERGNNERGRPNEETTLKAGEVRAEAEAEGSGKKDP